MRRYYIALAVLAVVMVVAAFAVRWVAPESYLGVMPLLALYFAAVTGTQHFLVVHSMTKSPRRFVQVFLGATVAVLFLHLVVLAAYLFTHTSQAVAFTIAFAVGFAVALVFETVALLLYIRRLRQQ